MITLPSSRYLTHPHPVWQGCTLNELLILGTACALGMFLLVLIATAFFGHMMVFFLIEVVSIYGVVRVVANVFARYKKGKPYNFLVLDIERRLGLNKYRITRAGVWETRRTFLNRQKR